MATLAEHLKKPAPRFVGHGSCLSVHTGFRGSLVYLGQLVWPDSQSFANVETVLMDVPRRVGGTLLFQVMALLLVIANLGSRLTDYVGSARLLLGMGRDNVLPRLPFACLDPGRNTSTYSIRIMGILAFVGTLLVRFELAGEIICLGAFLTFAGVNLAALHKFYLGCQPDRERNLLIDGFAPGLGCLFCLWIFWNLPPMAKIAEVAWLLSGFIYDAIKARGFRTSPVMIDSDKS